MKLSKNNKNISITKQQIVDIEKTLISIADNKNIIANGGDIVYHDKFKYKHTFADSVYVRQMTIEKGEIILGAIHKHLHMCFLLKGHLTFANESGVKEYTAPCYIVSDPGVKRVLYAHEDSLWYNTHQNISNTENVDQLEKELVALSYEEYKDYINNKNK